MVRPTVYRVAGSAVSREQAWLAAVLAAGPEVVLSFRSAAALWGLRAIEADGVIDLLTASANRPKLQGVRAHRTLHLPAADRRIHRRIAVTSPERTIVDVCGLVPFPVLERATDDALRRELLTVEKLARCAAAVPRSGGRKIRPVHALLADRPPGYDPGGSDRELDVVKVIKRARLRQPKQRHRVRVEGRSYELDLAWPEAAIAIEFDGWEVHGTSVTASTGTGSGGGRSSAPAGRSTTSPRGRRSRRSSPSPPSLVPDARRHEPQDRTEARRPRLRGPRARRRQGRRSRRRASASSGTARSPRPTPTDRSGL